MSAAQQSPAGAVDLSGQVAIVTGGGSGIGRAMSLSFASAGATVMVLDIVAGRAEETVGLIEAAGGTGRASVFDIADAEAIDGFVSDLRARSGRIDILCNNAGVMDRMHKVADVPTEIWDRVLRVNLTAPFLMTRAVVPAMVERGRGCIINTASIASLRGAAAGAAYTASKHGLMGLTRNTAFAYASDGIRCNAICPGAVATNIVGEAGLSALDAVGMQSFGQVMALNGDRIAPPEKMASVALFLASEGASFINGAIIPVDMGWSAA